MDIQVPITITQHQELAFVGQFQWDKEVNELSMRRTIGRLWGPGKGMNIKKLNKQNRYLFKFFHVHDYERIWNGCPWSFNMRLLTMAPFQNGDDPESIPVNTVPFWVQVFGVPLGFASTNICEAIGNFVGTYLDTDENNFKVSCPIYLRVRVLIDI